VASKGRKKPSLQSLSRLPMNLETYFNELKGESDRACALIAGAAVSDGLCDVLRHYFVKLDEVDINHLFYDQHASLSDFASRTDIAFALGLISPQQRVAANVIRKIRNQFAHTLAQIDFSNELIISELLKVSPINSLGSARPKDVFIGTTTALYLALLNCSTYLMERHLSGLGAIPVPVYHLAQQHSIKGGGNALAQLVTPSE
jgi:hypothetical protein